MDLEQRLKNDLLKFEQKSSDQYYERFMALIQGIHESAWAAIDGKQSGLDKFEFAHALSVLAPELSERGPLPQTAEELPTKVEKDGSLLGTGKWELLDLGWLEALAGWFEHLDNRAEFDTNPQTVPISNDTSLCIAGDWGTGYWRKTPLSAAEKVKTAMVALQPDLTIHLGDVYYAGSADQEQANLVDIWPAGSQGTFTLNSNHEMYDGAFSYFDALAARFQGQKGCSYFALENDDWLIVGLDSAYHADEWTLYMDGDIGDAQRQWLRGLPARRGSWARPGWCASWVAARPGARWRR